MNKFLVLLKKEIVELLTPQMIIPFVAMVVVFMAIGNVIGKEAKKQNGEKVRIAVVDNDKSQTSTLLLSTLEAAGYQITDKEVTSTVTIPSDFSEKLAKQEQPNVTVSTQLSGLSIANSLKTQKTAQVGGIISDTMSTLVLQSKFDPKTLQFSKQPVKIIDEVSFNGKTAQITLGELFGFLIQQTTVVPIVLFLVITLASQLVATAIASEKENKTLETLLSMPISRKSIVAGKLIASGIVSFFTSALYLVGMRSYMNGITGQATGAVDSSKVQQALQTLGLNFTTTDYLLLGLSLFLGILVALSLAFILGTFVEDIKSIQGAITPLMVMLLIPYVLSLVMDITQLSPTVKVFVYAIPFTHTFTAYSNIALGKFTDLYLGMGYLFVVFIIGIIIASKLFSSEKIFTLKLNFAKKGTTANTAAR